MTITRTKTLTILGNPATEKPFLWRTGKVQQNAKDGGGGDWSIPHSGFTSQLKYKAASGRFNGMLNGFHFTRGETDSDGWVVGSSPAVKEQPHIWLIESDINSQLDNVVLNPVGASASAAGWTAGTGTTVISVSPYAPSVTGTAIRLQRSSTDGKISARQNGILVVGVRYRVKTTIDFSISSLRTLKIGDDSEETGSFCRIKNTSIDPEVGWSDRGVQITEYFTATTTNFLIISSSTAWTSSDYISIIGLEVVPVSSVPLEIWLCSEGTSNSVSFDTIEDLRVAALAAINTASDLTYELDDDGDLILASETYTAHMIGPVPFVAGWGWFSSPEKRSACMTEMVEGETTGSAPQFALWRAEKSTQGPTKTKYNFEIYRLANANDVYTYLELKNKYVLHVRARADEKPIRNKVIGDDTETFVKNHSDCAYYYYMAAVNRAGPSAVLRKWPILEDGRIIQYAALSGFPAAVGDKIEIQNGPNFYCYSNSDLGDGTSLMNVYSYYNNSDTQKIGYIRNSRQALYWANGWIDYSDEVLNGSDTATAPNETDPHMIIDASETTATNPVDLIKQLLGDNTRDFGVPKSYQCTTVQDIFGLTASDRNLIEWAKLRKLIESQKSSMGGVEYSLKVPVGQGEKGAKEIDILALLQGVCITHGISMVWRYKESQRSWVLGFQANDAETFATSINGGTFIDTSKDVLSKPTAINGGDFSYSGISAEYKSDSADGKATYDITDGTGRVQHGFGGKILKVSDDLTFVPVGSSAFLSVRNRLQEQLLRLSFQAHRMRAELKLSTAVMLKVGAGCVAELPYLLNPRSGSRGGLQSCTCESINIDLGGRARVNAELSVSRLQLSGISPSMIIDTWARTDSVIAVTGLPTDSAEFSDYDETGLTDLATFGCWSYSESKGLYKRDNTCGDYRCWLFKVGAVALTTASTANVWPCTIAQPTAAQIAAGTATITLLDNATDFPASTSGDEYCLIFASRDNADLQDCQTTLYGWIGDKYGECADSDSAIVEGIKIGA